MKTSDFYFSLPERLIAQAPLAERSASRLLVLNGQTGEVKDQYFRDIVDLLNPGDLLVFNNTRVIPARLFGRKESGGQIEVLIERVLGEHAALAHIRASKSPKPGTRLLLDGCIEAVMHERHGRLFELHFGGEENLVNLLEAHGHMPLPPYIDRPDDEHDQQRYQTVYAKKAGAVAAPTAGLHFDDAILAKLTAKGVAFAEVTLHVGAGTFQPVKVDNIVDHEMHAEYLEVEQAVVDAVLATKARGGRVVAVGTTSVRSLESASQAGQIAPFFGDTSIFIYPGYEWKTVDALITNFHLPESTLIMLVSAFAGYENTMQAYKHAVEQAYRFFSYGDAMFIAHRAAAGTEK